MQLNLDPTKTRVVIVALLIFIYSLTAQSALMSTLQSRMPEPNEWLYYIFAALGADAVYILTFLGVSVPETKPAPT